MAAVETTLNQARAARQPALVTYVTGGVRPGWTDLVAAMADAGADAIEIGIPFSDPMLDGPVIQATSAAAIARGATPGSILAELAAARPAPVPLIAMAYANHACLDVRFCQQLADAGLSGTIVPDLPLGEADNYLDAAGQAGLDATLMVAPSTPEPQARAIAARTRGFLYIMSVMATTGTATDTDQQAAGWAVAARARQHSSRPVLIGFGIATPRDVAAAARHADGVIVASALMRCVLAGDSPAAIARRVGALRTALDQAAA